MTVAGVALFVALGLWQLERADYKESIELRFEQRLGDDYRVFNSNSDLADIEYRKLIVRGRYDNAHNILVDNQLHRGRAGYYVLTPLHLVDSDDIMLVNRGWAAWGESREQMPSITQPDNTDSVAGTATFPNEPALRLGEFQVSDGWPQLVPYVDIKILQPRYDGRLLPVVLWLAPEQPGHYLREWDPVWMRPEKSRAYATQWFAFALLAVVFFIILNLRKIE